MLSSLQRYVQNQYVAGFSAALLAMVSGATFIWPSPILPLFEKEKYKNVVIPMTTTEISWMISLIELGSLLSPIISGVISDIFGRKQSIAFAGPFIIAGWLLILLTRDVFSLYIIRVLHGFGMGILFTSVPIYLGEIAEAKVRGGLTSLLQTMWYTGFLFQYVVGSYLSYDNSAIVNLVLSTVAFIFFFLLQPESPYYLTMKKCDEKANRSLMLLRGKSSTKDVETECQNIKDCIEKDMKNKSKWSDAFKLTRIDIKVLLIVQAISIFRLGSGTVSISSYLGEIFRLAQWNYLSARATMTLYGVITLIFIVIAMLSIDLLGRRPLLIFSCIGTGICTAILGLFFWFDLTTNFDLSSLRWIPALALVGYTIIFALGLGPVTQTIQSELFPTNIRAFGNIITAYNLTITSFLFLRSYQIIVDFSGVYTNFFIFSAVSFIGAIIIYIYVPETKGKTFLEISEFFNEKKEILPTINSATTRL